MKPAARAPFGAAPSVAIALAVLLAACTSASIPVVPPSAPPVTVTPPAVASGPAGPTDPGTPPDAPVTAPGSPGSSDPPPRTPGIPGPQPTMVTPAEGLSGVHPVGASAIEAQVSGRNVIVRLSWWSGPAPCSVLAGVDTARDGTTFTLTIREGAAQEGVACPEIAMLKATVVNLGAPGPGIWTIAAYGPAPAVQVTVTG